jgi:hypothetical protein
MKTFSVDCLEERTMPDSVDQYIDLLQQRQKDPERGILAATALGRELRLRNGMRLPLVLGPEDDRAISALTLALWDMNVSPAQRSAAAWALGQMGGAQPTLKLLTRLETIFVHRGARVLGANEPGTPQESSHVCATLVEALSRAVQPPTHLASQPYNRQQLYRVCRVLLDYARNPQESDPDFAAALSMSLAKLAVRVGADMPKDTLRTLLNAPEPVATLAAVGVISELIPADEQRQQLLERHDGIEMDMTQDDIFLRLGKERGEPYSFKEIDRLIRLAAHYWSAENDVQLAGEHLEVKIRQILAGNDPSRA